MRRTCVGFAYNWVRERANGRMPIPALFMQSQPFFGADSALHGVLLGKLTGARSVIHMHVGYGDWQSGLVKWAMHHADAVVGVSNFVAESIVHAGYDRARVHVVHNALDLTGWPADLDGVPT